MFRRQRAVNGGATAAMHAGTQVAGPSPLASLVEDVARRLQGRYPEAAGVEAALREALAERRLAWEPEAGPKLACAVADRLSGFGPVGPLLRDPSVSEVMINGPDEVFVERRGRLERSRARFRSSDEVLHLIERVVSPLGLRVDPSSPWVDARLPDGSRFHAVVAPVSLCGPVVTIRKFPKRLWSLDDLVTLDAVGPAQADLLAAAVLGRRNLLVSGGTSTGKTTLLGALARLVPPGERLITIEDAAELRLGSRHAVCLETRPPNVEGLGAVAMRDLVRCAMRMRPDRIVVGEVRGAEALDMLQALCSGHAGSMCTVHASSPPDALMRLETMAMMAAPGLSVEAARRQVASAVSLIVHMARDPDGRRRVAEIVDLGGGR